MGEGGIPEVAASDHGFIALIAGNAALRVRSLDYTCGFGFTFASAVGIQKAEDSGFDSLFDFFQGAMA